MKTMVLIDKDGWVSGIVNIDGEFVPEHYPASKYTQVDPATGRKIARYSCLFWHDGNNLLCILDPKRIWRQIRSHGWHGNHGAGYFNQILNADLKEFPDEAGKAPIADPITLKKFYQSIYATELQPNLILRQSTEADLDVWEREMVNSDLYDADKAWIQAASWLSDPMTWAISTVYKKELLQIESYQFRQNSNVVKAGFTAHIDNERPFWFWQQVAVPVFNALDNYGIEKIESQIRVDRPEWADALKTYYGAEELDRPLDSKSIPLRYQIENSLTKIGNWPTRRTIADWGWKNKDISVREGTETDLSMIQDWGRKANSIWSSKENHAGLIDKWWNIDKASILIAYQVDKILDIWLIRKRTNDLCGVVSLGLKDPTTLDLIRPGMYKWQRDVGYTYSSFFVSKEFNELDVVRNLALKGWVVEKEHKQFTKPMIEYRVKL